MSRHLFALVVLLVTVMPAVSSMRAGVAAATKAVADDSDIRQLEREWDEALRVRNAHALNRILADGYTLVDASGAVMSKADYLMSVVKTPDRVRATAAMTDGLEIVVSGDTATVSGRSALRGRPRQRGQSVSDAQQFTSRWIKVNGAWQAVSTTMLDQTR